MNLIEGIQNEKLKLLELLRIMFAVCIMHLHTSFLPSFIACSVPSVKSLWKMTSRTYLVLKRKSMFAFLGQNLRRKCVRVLGDDQPVRCSIKNIFNLVINLHNSISGRQLKSPKMTNLLVNIKLSSSSISAWKRTTTIND